MEMYIHIRKALSIIAGSNHRSEDCSYKSVMWIGFLFEGDKKTSAGMALARKKL